MDEPKSIESSEIPPPAGPAEEIKAESPPKDLELPQWNPNAQEKFESTRTSVDVPQISARRNKVPLIVALVSAITLVLLSIYFWIDSTKHFPEVSAGSYIGSIEGVFADNEHEQTDFYLERGQAEDEVLFILLKQGWKPQKIVTVMPAAEKAKSRWLLPLIAAGEGSRLQLVGEDNGDHAYHGVARELVSGREGTWKLTPIFTKAKKAEGKETDIKLWSLLRGELIEIQKKVQEYQQKADTQKAEIKKLSDLITEGEQLRSRANDKFVSVRDQLADLREQLANRQEEIMRLEESFQVSEKVTGMGKLVLLSRESLDREWRAIDSLLRTEVSKESPALDEEVARAEKILAIQSAIEIERSRINELVNQTQSAPTISEVGGKV